MFLLQRSTYSTRIKAGAELIETLSSSLYRNAYYVLDELISNAYDADASKVDIRITDDEIVISDNGEGMDREDLENYLWLGYSEKLRENTTRKFRRHRIGKFGIGKLSMHVICDICRIATTKNGTTRSLTLDFGKILSHKGLGEEKIKVRESKAKRGTKGTTVRLRGLKKNIVRRKAVKRILRNMPLSPVFRVKFNEKTLKPEDIIKGKTYGIHLNLPLTGRVDGKLVHSDTPLGEFAGIYIKVHGRTVNPDDPNILNILNTKSGPENLYSRLYGVILADGLNDVVLATRNGFREDSSKYLEFKQALSRELRKITRDIFEEQSQKELQHEAIQLHDVVHNQISRMLKAADLPDDFLRWYRRRPDLKEAKATVENLRKKQRRRTTRNKRVRLMKNEVASNDGRNHSIRIKGHTLRFELAAMGKEAYECVLDGENTVFYINVDHPQYTFAREEGSLSHHFRRVVVFEVARCISGESSTELVAQYQNMMQQIISE